MRVRIVLNLKDKRVSVNYHSLLQGVIYSSLFNNEQIKDVHDNGYKLGKRKFKLFTFSELYGEAEYLKSSKELLFKEKGYFDFTSHKDDLVIELVSYLIQNKSIILGTEKIDIISYSILDDSVSNEKEETYHTTSPITTYITCEGKKTYYYSPDEKEFSESIINNLSQKYYLIYEENMPDISIIEIKNVKMKMVKYRKIFSIAYHCDIKFNNLTPKVKRVILTCGLGAKNSSGFGMVTTQK